jgi:hypothetical protein
VGSDSVERAKLACHSAIDFEDDCAFETHPPVIGSLIFVMLDGLHSQRFN